MTKLDFEIPFSAFEQTNFINCFASVYIYLEGLNDSRGVTPCAEWETGVCNNCKRCATKPQALQERIYFLFDTISGRSALRNRFDGSPSGSEVLINSPVDITSCTYSRGGGSDDNIDFIFGFAGYDYTVVRNPDEYMSAVDSSLKAGRPVIARLKGMNVDFCVITGVDDGYILPCFKAAQASPERAPTDNDISALYIPLGRIVPRYDFVDALRRIERIMSRNLDEGLWDGCIEKIGLYQADGLDGKPNEVVESRIKRLCEIMWFTFNCHNFAEVFRSYESSRESDAAIYGDIGGIDRLRGKDYSELIKKISSSYGYTHDLSWSVIYIADTLNLSHFASHYIGEMLELTLFRLKQNDIDTLECIRELIKLLTR